MNLYNVKSIQPTGYLVTKFDEDLNILASYITTLTTCDCPAGPRPTCRHRQMLPQFIENKAIDANLFYDFDTNTFYDGPREEPLDDVVMDELNATLTTQTEVLATMAEVVSETDGPTQTKLETTLEQDIMTGHASQQDIDTFAACAPNRDEAEEVARLATEAGFKAVVISDPDRSMLDGIGSLTDRQDMLDSITDDQIAITNLKSGALDDVISETKSSALFIPASEKDKAFFASEASGSDVVIKGDVSDLCDDEGCPHFGTPHGHAKTETEFAPPREQIITTRPDVHDETDGQSISEKKQEMIERAQGLRRRI